jgi:hypothetical protein
VIAAASRLRRTRSRLVRGAAIVHPPAMTVVIIAAGLAGRHG